jgi:ferredoxin
MPYVVTEDCIRCKYMDCVQRCPVHCFREGENMLVIDPDECIDCAACESNCPVAAIVSDIDARAANWTSLNRRYAAVWPRIVEKGEESADARKWHSKSGKYARFFSPAPGLSHLQRGK